MDVDDPTRKLDFDEYSQTPPKKPRPQTQASEEGHLEVFLRIRPKAKSKESSVEYTISNENTSIRLTSPNQSDIRNYSFDYIFDQNTTNTQVFDKIGKIAINRFVNGYSNLIFSYGITGSGKTHTIMGSNNKLNGLIPSILNQLFNISLHNTNNKYNIFASYMENYTKEVFDLLVQNGESNPLNIRVLPTGIDIPDLKTMEITNVSEALQLIEFGNNKRRQAHTKLNTNSSRSHALFILDLYSNSKLQSQLCIVDLAGSESVKRTGFKPDDQRFIESCDINTSLSVLSRCICSIKDNNNSIPWREHILTKILYEYLTGNGYVNMIVNAHINNDDYSETIRAIEFGSNSQNITMNPVVNSVRMSTRHKSRIMKCVNDSNGVPINHINYINQCKDIKQLKSIAIESYKTVFKSKYVIHMLKDKKIKQIDMLINKYENNNKIEAIQEEESENEIDMENNRKYKELEQQLAEKEMAFEEKIAEINHLYGELKGKNEVIETYKNKLLDRDVEINKYKMDYNEMERYKNDCEKYKQQLERVNKNAFNINDQMCKYKERENELMVSKSKLEANVNRYKVVMDENEQKIERLGHMVRDSKEKLQKKCIEISEKDERLRKLANERDKLEEEYNEKCHILEKNINMFTKINEDAREEIVSLNKGNIEKENKYKNMKSKYDELMNVINEKDKQMDVLNKYNLDINTQMKIKNEIINRKDEKIKELMDEINNKEYINELMEKMEGKNKQIQVLNECNNALKEKMNKKLNEMKNEMCIKDNEMESLGKCNEVLKEEMKKLNDEMKDKFNRERDEMNRSMKEKDQLILGLKKDTSDMEGEIVEKDELILSLTEYKLAKDKEIENANKYILENDNNIKDMNNEINKLKNILNEERVSNDTIINDLYNKRNESDVAINKYKIEMDVEINIKNEEINKLKEQLKKGTEKYDKIIYELNNEIKEMNGKLNDGNKQLNDKTCLLSETKNELSDLKHKLNDVLNEKNQLMRELNTIINDKNQLIGNEKFIENEKNELMIKLSNCMSEKNILIKQLNDITNEKNNKLNECNNYFEKYENLKLKHNKQCNVLTELQLNINKLNNELDNNKNNIKSQIKQIENELTNELNSKMKQFESKINEINTHKNNIIEQWKQKYSEYNMKNLELTDKYERLENEFEKTKEFHRIALTEADEQYNLAQKEIGELYELNNELEKQKKDKIELEKQVNMLQQQLNNLKLKSLPPNSNNNSNRSHKSNSNKSNKTRKRPRQEMENRNDNITNPNKKRKITIDNTNGICNENNNSMNNNISNGIIIDENDNNDTDNDIIIENNDNITGNNEMDNDIIFINNNNNNNEDSDIICSKSNSLQPKKLINELINIPNKNNNNIPSDNKSENELDTNGNIESNNSYLSHLSEGSSPLPKLKSSHKITRLSVGTIKQKQQQFKLMRTPATKQIKPIRYSDFTPCTKTGLRALRCVDLKQKLKKHDLKAYGKKEDLVVALYNHKNKNNNNKNNNSSDDESMNQSINNNNKCDGDSDESDIEIDYQWIGKYTFKCDGNTYYNGIRVNGIEYFVGSMVYVYSEDKNEEWMSKIVSLFEDEDGDAFMGNMWYWKYNEIIKAVKNNYIIKNKNLNENDEVFVSDGHEPDINHIALMITKRKFKVFKNKNKLDMEKKNNNKKNKKKKKNEIEMYFGRYSFNTKTKKLCLIEYNENENNSEDEINNKENINKNNKGNRNKRQRGRNRRKKKTT